MSKKHLCPVNLPPLCLNADEKNPRACVWLKQYTTNEEIFAVVRQLQQKA